MRSRVFWKAYLALLSVLLAFSPSWGDIYDGQWHDIGSGWSYIYVPASQSGFGDTDLSFDSPTAIQAASGIISEILGLR